MSSKHQLTGMTGVYLVAARLSSLGFIVSPTSRSAYGADLLVTDAKCKRSYAVQVKTNSVNFRYWLLSRRAKEMHSRNLIYALVNLRGDQPEYFLVPSLIVARHVRFSPRSKTRKADSYSVHLEDIAKYKEKWRVFRNTHGPTKPSSGRGKRRRAA